MLHDSVSKVSSRLVQTACSSAIMSAQSAAGQLWCKRVTHSWNSILRVILSSHISVSGSCSSGEIWQKMMAKRAPGCDLIGFQFENTSWEEHLCFVFLCNFGYVNDTFHGKWNGLLFTRGRTGKKYETVGQPVVCFIPCLVLKQQQAKR